VARPASLSWAHRASPSITLLLLAASLLSGAAHAAPVRLVTGENYVPYTDKRLPHGGMATEIVERAFAHVARSVTLSWKPWRRGYAETRARSYDATFPYLQTDERARHFIYSSPIVELELRLFSKRDAGLDAGQPASLAGKVACQPLGWAEPPLLAALRARGQLQIIEPSDMGTCVKMVAMGRADFFVADRLQGLDAVRQQQVHDIDPGTAVLGSDAICLIAPRANPASAALISDFNRGLRKLRDSGEHARILSSHSVAEAGGAQR
jgi:polar amino acid transport system substrate-binding protein